MNIVIEGHDNSGKSTLAHILATQLNRQVFSSEGPEKAPGELTERVQRYGEHLDVIFDRHPCVSDPIYSMARGKPCVLSKELIDSFYTPPILFIYCDPGTRGLGSHIRKAHDTDEHMAAVESHYASLLAKYRQWAVDHAHFVYRMGDDINKLMRSVKAHLNEHFDPMRDVEDFMIKFGQFYNGNPRALPDDLHDFREKFMLEELKEYIDSRPDSLDGDKWNKEIAILLEDQLDSLVDLAYVIFGTAQLQGFDFREAWRRVHQANMKKERATSADQSTRHSAFDVIKPVGWVKPDHADLVAHHIHKPVVSQR